MPSKYTYYFAGLFLDGTIKSQLFYPNLVQSTDYNSWQKAQNTQEGT